MPPDASSLLNSLPPPPPVRQTRQHGVKGVYYGGDWVDMEDLVDTFNPSEKSCSGCPDLQTKSCPRSKSRNDASIDGTGAEYDVVIVGAGCIGSAIARELSRYKLSVLLIEAADDVSQGATKGNSGIVHAGYDDKPGSVRAKFCWPGNQMFPQLDKELRFGYQKNGSLVLAFNEKEKKVLDDLKKRGETNGVKRLRIIDQKELQELEPAVHPDAIAALLSPDAGNVIPYEFAIALAENAADNGVEVRVRREVTAIFKADQMIAGADNKFEVEMRRWEPQNYVEAQKARSAPQSHSALQVAGSYLLSLFPELAMGVGLYMVLDPSVDKATKLQALYSVSPLVVSVVVIAFNLSSGKDKPASDPLGLFPDLAMGLGLCMVLGPTVDMEATQQALFSMLALLIFVGLAAFSVFSGKDSPASPLQSASGNIPFKQLAKEMPQAEGTGGKKVEVEDMFTGGSGSWNAVKGTTVAVETVRAKYVVNAAGGASDKIAAMIGDNSFTIKPRLGDYLLLNRNQGYLTTHTLFPCPDPKLGKGVLVQTTLWGNLILGPTARDTYNPSARDMTDASVQEYILSKCKALVPYFDPRETFHAFCGARAKNSTGDWIVRPSESDKNMIHAAGIDSPGLAGSPAIAVEVVKLLRRAGLATVADPNFNPNRAPIITPKAGLRGLKMGPLGKNDAKGPSDVRDEKRMASNVVCKCEKVTELEVVRALHRSLPIDSTQAIRKRTRAGMGHCQGEPDNYDCERRVRAIIARENRVPVEEVGGRPWPATSTLSQRWIDDKEKDQLKERMMAQDKTKYFMLKASMSL